MQAPHDMASSSAAAAACDPEDPDDELRMTHFSVTRIVREAGGYRAAEANDKVWLHARRFMAIENLEKWTGVVMLHLENNQISVIGTGLRHMAGLKALYLHCNMLRHIDENLAGRWTSCVVLTSSLDFQ